MAHEAIRLCVAAVLVLAIVHADAVKLRDIGDSQDLWCATASHMRNPDEHAYAMMNDPDFSYTYSRVQPVKVHVDNDNGPPYTRCYTTAYAEILYFCGAATALHAAELRFQITGAREMGAILARARETKPHAAQVVIRGRIHDDVDDTFGHVFALQVQPNGKVQLYQSFIDEYTLQTHLQRTPAFGDNELKRFLDNLATLEANATTDDLAPFTYAQKHAYYDNFRVFLNKKKTSGNITVQSYIACVMPPKRVSTNGISHAQVEASFVDEKLQNTVLGDLARREEIHLPGGCPAFDQLDADPGRITMALTYY